MSKKSKITVAWILMLGWMGFIFYMSSQPANVSSAQSGLVLKIIQSLGFNINGQYVDLATTIIRKGAHVTEYLILALLAYNVIRHYFESRKARFLALLVVILYAASDEFHQNFVLGRAGRITDVFIDTSGGIIGFIVIGIFNVKEKWLGDKLD